MPLNRLFLLLDPRPWLEGFCELKSVLLFVRTFSWNWLISFFSGTQYVVRAPCGVMGDRAGFFENNIFAPKMGKMEQNGQNLVFSEFIRKFSD